MSQQTINLGAVPNDGTGDPARTAFGKCNTNFTELYSNVPNWVGLRSYSVGNVAIAPEGRLIVCNTAHTSTLTYDVRNWTYVGSDDSALIDYTLLPNGIANTSRPTSGKVKTFGQLNPDSTQYSIVNGRFTETSAGSGVDVFYFPLDLPIPAAKIQHIWIEFEVSASPTSNSPLTLIVSNYTGTTGSVIDNCPVHWSFYGNIGGTLLSRWDAGPYNCAPVTKTTQVPINEYNAGKQVRLDITIDSNSGKISGWYNGNCVIQYTEAAIVPFVTTRALFEFYGGTYKVKKFAISDILPDFANSGTKKLEIAYGNDYSAVLPLALSATWVKIYEFNVAFDNTGKIQLFWTPRIDCTAGAVYIAIGIAGSVPPSGYGFVNNVCEATTRCRVPYIEIVTSTPNTTQVVAVWAKTSGTATIQNQTYGDKIYGPSWRPVTDTTMISVI